MAHDLVPYTTISGLVTAYQEGVANVRSAVSMFDATQRMLDQHFTLGKYTSSIQLTTDGKRVVEFHIEKMLSKMRRDAWRAVVDRLDIWRIMSSERAKELKGMIDNDTLPELTETTAFQLARAYMSDLDKLFDELVKEVFDQLRPHAYAHTAKYKSNRQDVVGRRVVLQLMIQRDYLEYSGKWRVCTNEQQTLRVLENVFRALDGKGVTGKDYYSELQMVLEASEDGVGRTEYFEFSAYKNGNMHITFLREDLLAELNRRAGGNNLTK